MPKPFHAASYPTDQDADTAFVAEVATLDGMRSHLTRTPSIVPINLRDEAADIARVGRLACSAYDGTNMDYVGQQVQSVFHMDTIDTAAFITAAAGVYCPQSLVTLGSGISMTDGVVAQPVTPQCPRTAAITITVGPIANSSGDGTWTYTLTNASDYGAFVTLDEKYAASGYVGDWGPGTDSYTGIEPHPALFVPAHGHVSDTGRVMGSFFWKAVKYRVASWLPVSCEVQNLN